MFIDFVCFYTGLGFPCPSYSACLIVPQVLPSVFLTCISVLRDLCCLQVCVFDVFLLSNEAFPALRAEEVVIQ